jgi:hypothetical protein
MPNYALSMIVLQTPFPPGFIPHEAVDIIQSFFITVAVIALGIPLMRAFTRRFVDRPPITPVLAANVENRLERIEQAVEAVAIEVERISESQRFLTKLMAEPRSLPGGGSAGGSAGGSGRQNA